MEGREFRAIREQLRLSKNAFALALGYTGNSTNNTNQISRYENEKRQIPLYIARLAWLLGRIDAIRSDSKGIEPALTPDDWTVVRWPAWPGYNFEIDPVQERFGPAPSAADERRTELGTALSRTAREHMIDLGGNATQVLTDAVAQAMERIISEGRIEQ